MTDQISAKIISLAKEAKGAKITRADLAYELRDLGVEEDSIYVSKMVWDVYSAASDSVASLIASTYTGNTTQTSVVDEYASKHYLDSNDHTSALTHIGNNSSIAGRSLEELTAQLSGKPARPKRTKKDEGLLTAGISKIVGTAGVQEVKKEATMVVQQYTSLINVYEGAKMEVKDVMNDFVDIRHDVIKNFDKYVLMLTDFFGDSIKSVAPILFDFDSVEYLDTQEMLKNIMLKYDKLTEDCSILISEISESFSSSLQEASHASKDASKGFGLAIAASFALSHYLAATDKTARMKMELDKLKLNVKHDTVAIKGDYARLATIYKTINDLYIPKANVYYRYSDEVLGEEFKKMLETLYADAGVKDMVEKRSKLLDYRKELCDLIADHKENASYYEEDIKHCSEIKAARQNEYVEAIAKRPQQPNLIANIFTLGQAKKKYNRHVFDWNASYGKVVKEYENLDVSIKADSAELDNHKSEIESLESELKKLSENIKAQTSQIMSAIKVAPEMKKQLAEHIESIIKLLYIAKDIIQSGLEERQIKAVKVEEYTDVELPADVKNSIHSFTNTMTDLVAENVERIANNVTIKVKEDRTEAMIAETARIDGQGKENVETIQDAQQAVDPTSQDFSQVEKPLYAAAGTMGNTTVMVAQTGFQLLGTLAEMKVMCEKNKMTSQEYDRKLQQFKNQFKQEMQAVDDKSRILNEILKKINTASDTEELKKALLLLSDGTDVFKSNKDIEDFLQGIKTINI